MTTRTRTDTTRKAREYLKWVGAVDALEITPGNGYWNAQHYPAGGKFCRASRDGRGEAVFNYRVQDSGRYGDMAGELANGTPIVFSCEQTSLWLGYLASLDSEEQPQ